MMTFWVLEPAVKFVVAGVLAFTTQVPVPLELNVPVVAVWLTKVHGPLIAVKVSAPSEFVVALTVKFEPGNVGVGAVPNVIAGVAAAMLTFWVLDPAVKFAVAGVVAFTTQVPAPLELNVPVVAVWLTKV